MLHGSIVVNFRLSFTEVIQKFASTDAFGRLAELHC